MERRGSLLCCLLPGCCWLLLAAAGWCWLVGVGRVREVIAKLFRAVSPEDPAITRELVTLRSSARSDLRIKGGESGAPSRL